MNNYKQMGDTLDLVAPYDVTSGAGFLVGSIFAVASVTATTGQTLSGCTRGVYDLKAKAADTGAVGAKVYWDNTAKEITTTASGNTLAGVLTEAKTNGPVLASVRLNGSFA